MFVFIVYSSLEDAFECSFDIVSEDCSQVGGMNLFEAWMNGLANVYKTLCLSDLDLVNSKYISILPYRLVTFNMPTVNKKRVKRIWPHFN